MKVGVLALQGAFTAHVGHLERLGVATTEVRTIAELDGVDSLVLPGGESTTMSRLLVTSGLREPLSARVRDGMPVLGTCAGMILLARRVLDGRADQQPLGAIDLTVRRNGYGCQQESFEAALTIAGMDSPFPGVFIRAPVVEDVGLEVEVLASHDGRPVLCAADNVLVASFHPELTGDDRLHSLYLDRFLEG